jgi:hypothetical protein
VKKIPTLFVRDPNNMSRVLNEVNPAAQWVMDVGDETHDEQHFATRKFDGTCMLLEDGRWWARREVKPGKTPPLNYRPEETDPNTGKTVGWEPVEQSSFVKAWADAISYEDGASEPGTYELCGPKVQGNPEGFERHQLIRHGYVYLNGVPRDFEGLAVLMKTFPFEGIVWHHPDGRMAKLKRRDFGY